MPVAEGQLRLQGLSEPEYGRICTLLGREPNPTELGVFGVMWSEHCSYKSSRLLLKSLPTQGADILQGPGENAGVVSVGDGWACVFKIESHNHPSYIEPFEGAATGVGGILRDVFTMGARPVAIMDSLRLGPPDSTKNIALLDGIVSGIGHYGNCFGVANLGGETVFDRCYSGNPLVNAFALGLARADRLFFGKASGVGNPVIYVGAKTGRDGIHGATASSTTMTGETLQKESAAVQIGHPITERRFATAIPALRDAGCICSITDLGAGGISCGAGEMGAETGVTLDLDSIPLKDSSLSAWEILLSESQERMLIALPPEKLVEATALLDRYEVGNTVIGCFTNSGCLEATWRGQKVVDLEMSFLWGACPVEPISVAEPQRKLRPIEFTEPRTTEEWSRAVHSVVGHWHCADQSAAVSQFDSTVQGRTAIGPYGGKNHHMPSGICVSAPLHGKSYGVVMTVAWNPFYGDVDPAGMAKLMLIEAVTKAVAAGADYHDLALCDNFYTPRVRPEVAWDLTRMVETIASLSIELGIPFISGKDSSSGTFESGGLSIEAPPTLAI